MSFVNIIEWIKVDLDQLLLQFSLPYYICFLFVWLQILHFDPENWDFLIFIFVYQIKASRTFVMLFFALLILNSIKQNQPFTLWIWFIFPTHLKGNFRWSLVSNLELTSSDLNKLWIMTTSLKKRKLEKRRTRKLKLTEGAEGMRFWQIHQKFALFTNE